MNGLLPNDMYREFAKNTPINAAMKALFSHLQQVEDYELQYEQLHRTRQWLMEQQSMMVTHLKCSKLNTLPLTLIRDKSSSSGGTFLRWRYLTNTGTGQTMWSRLATDDNQPAEIRQMLTAAERDRVLINMQMSVLNFILRQLKECSKKIEHL
ncbi:DUF3158 family protein [Exercitatus varius]|uniref:DUF3158 family protein n=1 Tax=Exercitatus varius TaxID=67857 RepID=UPI00294B3127|nr:DUF3158 family protein [Exercitatus varius]MDG2961742.1 DUF3158 family protein [Exercitatus varius]